jgi:NADH-quinone oxidoreductase subunit A
MSDITKLILSPPIAFFIVLFVSILLSRLFSRLSFHPECHTVGEGKSYACGEDNYDHMAQPDYSTFFPFAFFFTIAHVATLIMTTVPVETYKTFILAFLYITGAIVGLYILLRS